MSAPETVEVGETFEVTVAVSDLSGAGFVLHGLPGDQLAELLELELAL